MDSWVRFSAQTQAKDKLFRTAQYACMLLGYTIQKGGAGNDLLTKVRQLEAHISLGRKLLRLGNSADALETAKRTVHLSDGVLRLCLTVAHLNRAMYFVCDNVLWAGKTGLLPKLDQNKWSQRSFRYYLFALILSLTRDAYEVSLLMKRESRNEAGGGSKGAQRPAVSGEQWDLPQATGTGAPGGTLLPACLHRELALLAAVLRGNPPLLLDLLKNLCDLFIPLDRLGLYQTGNGFVGACGLASSLLSLLTIVHPWLKLKP